MLRKPCCGSHLSSNFNHCQAEELIETLLITFSIISRIVFVEHNVLIIASEAANGPLVYIIGFQVCVSQLMDLVAKSVGQT